MTLRRRFHMKAQEVAEQINIPLERWEGSCDAIAHGLIEHGVVEGKVVRGFWHGPMKGYWAKRQGIGFTQHSWVEMVGGTVVDPTRYSFEDNRPYVWIGTEDEQDEACSDYDEFKDMVCYCDHVVEEHRRGGFFSPCEFCIEWPYDEGGNRVREEHMGPAPSFDVDGMDYSTVDLPDSALDLLDKETRDHGWLSKAQLIWLANAPIYFLEPHEREAYEWIIERGGAAMIPWDNREKLGLIESPLTQARLGGMVPGK